MNIAEFGNQKIGFMAETDNDELSMCSMYQVPLRKDEQPQKICNIHDCRFRADGIERNYPFD